MADFLTKIIRKSRIRRSKSFFFFFWELLNTFLFYFIKKYNNNNHSFSSSDEIPSLLSFPALYSFSQLLHLQKSVQPEHAFDFELEHAFVSHFEAKKKSF